MVIVNNCHALGSNNCASKDIVRYKYTVPHTTYVCFESSVQALLYIWQLPESVELPPPTYLFGWFDIFYIIYCPKQ